MRHFGGKRCKPSRICPLWWTFLTRHYHSIPSDWPLEFSYTVTQNIRKKERRKEERVWLCLYTCTCSPLLLVRGATWVWNGESYRGCSWEPQCLCKPYNQGWLFPVQSSLTQIIYWVFIPSRQATVLWPVWETDGNFWRCLGCHCSEGPGAAIWSCSKAVLYEMAPNSKKKMGGYQEWQAVANSGLTFGHGKCSPGQRSCQMFESEHISSHILCAQQGH